MFARSFAAIVLVLPALAAASALPQNEEFTNDGFTTNNRPTQGNQPTMVNQCNTGSLQCCNGVQSVQSSTTATLLGLLGFVTGGPDTLFGTNCSPFTFLGSVDNSCTAQPVCCTGNNFKGLIVLGCNAVDLGSIVPVGNVAEVASLVGDIINA